MRAGNEEDGPNLGGPIYATPIVANGVLYFRSNAHLFAIYNASKSWEKPEMPRASVEKR